MEKLELVENKIITVSADAADLFTAQDLEILPALNVLAYFEEMQDGEEIEIKHEYNNIFNINGAEYAIYNDYDKAEADAVQHCVDIIEDCGVSENLLNIAINHNMVDLSWFMDAATEYAEDYAYNESIEYLADAEELEQIDAGIVSEDEIREKYYNSILPSNAEGVFDEFIYQFGRDYTIEIIKKYDLLNYEELAQYCVDVDGVAHFLAAYNGEELEYNNYYLYRVN